MEIVQSWLKDYLGKKLPSSKELDDLFTYHSYEVEGIEEREGETVIDLDVLPNRSSDSLSHRGVARELATLLDTTLENDPLAQEPNLPKTDKIEIKIADSVACPRFTLSLIIGVEVKESPEWLQKRLKALGQRPINNIVDATNYVMYALGQPMHAYDADKFPQKDGRWQFDVRFAEESEKVSLLSEGGKGEDRVVELKGTDLLIVDGSSNVPVGLAGVKGGRFAEMDAGTKNIIIEAAHFHPSTIRKTARRLGILTDASRRFENEPSRELPPYAQKEIIELITKIAGGECEGMTDVYLEKYEPVTTTVRIEKVNALLGLSLTSEEIQKIIERTGSEVQSKDKKFLSVTAPWERTDLNVEVDYVEEVGRIHGLSGIDPIAPETLLLPEVNKKQYYSERVRQALVQVGFSEIITSSFLKKAKIQLQNALASDKSYVRNTLVKNINAALDANISHTDLLGLPDVRVFEIGTVFDKTETGVGEHVSLGLGARTKGNGYNQKDDKVLQEGIIAVEEALGEKLDWQTEKGVSECNFGAALKVLPVPDSYEQLSEQPPVTFRSISPYPAIARDVALWVGTPESSEVVLAALLEVAGDLCVRQTLFDTFTKDGRTSYAFRFVFQAKNRTLTDDEVNDVMETIYKVAKEKGWEVR
jgi:phenylalanyl-tRNA synthetase beta chain